MIPKRHQLKVPRKKWAVVDVQPDGIRLRATRSSRKVNVNDLFSSSYSRFYVNDLDMLIRHIINYLEDVDCDSFRIIGELQGIAVKLRDRRFQFVDAQQFFMREHVTRKDVKKIEKLFYERFGVDIHRHWTLSSVFLDVYRRKYQKTGWNNPFYHKGRRRNVKLFKRITSATHGGRCEVYYMTKQKNVVSLDYNSFYAYLYTLPVPFRYIGSITVKGSDVFSVLENHPFSLVTGHFHVNRTYMPPVPRKTNALFFPTGCLSNFKGIYMSISAWSFEFQEKEVSFLDDEVYIIDMFDSEAVLKDFATDLYELRRSHVEFSEFFKLGMDQLWGKLCQKEAQKVIQYARGSIFDVMNEVIAVTKKGVFFTEDRRVKRNFQHYHVGSAYPALGRRILLETMRISEKDIVYCDTDEIIIRKSALSKFEHLVGEGLGQLKVKKRFSEFLAFRAKAYVGLTDAEYDIVISGIPKRLTEKALRREKIERIEDVHAALTTTRVKRRVPLQKVMRERLNPFDSMDFYRRRIGTLKTKRRKLENGTTEPFHFECVNSRYAPTFFRSRNRNLLR